jgi:hypothetical protein
MTNIQHILSESDKEVTTLNTKCRKEPTKKIAANN